MHSNAHLQQPRPVNHHLPVKDESLAVVPSPAHHSRQQLPTATPHIQNHSGIGPIVSILNTYNTETASETPSAHPVHSTPVSSCNQLAVPPRINRPNSLYLPDSIARVTCSGRLIRQTHLQACCASLQAVVGEVAHGFAELISKSCLLGQLAKLHC